MTHKCKFVKYRHRPKRKTISYKCHGCFLVVVMRKRALHRMTTRVGYRGYPLTKYYDVNDPRYQQKAISEEEAWRELFSYEFNHS